jgi:hypothetical protein
LLLEQRQGLLQPPPRNQDHRLVTIAAQQRVERFRVTMPGVKGFFQLHNAKGLFQLTNPPCQHKPVVSNPALTCTFFALKET